jgi:hypothetical protein
LHDVVVNTCQNAASSISTGLLSQGRRLMGTEHLSHAAEACGFAVAQLDMAALPFAQQLQVRH